MAKATPGLKKRGNIWHIEKTICGVRVYRSTQTGELAEAERYLAEVTRQIRERVIFGGRDAHTLDDAAAKYLLENSHKRGISRQGIALKHMVERFGDMPIDQIRPDMFDKYVIDRGVSGTTLLREFGALRAVLTQCATRWRDGNGHYWLDRIPAMPVLHLDPRKPRPITHAEQAKLFAELPGYLATMALFAVNTGCRDQEICGLRWGWERDVVGLDRTVFLIPGEVTKNGNDKLVPLNRIAASVVDGERGKHTEYVFTFSGHRLDRMNNRAWKLARKRVGLDEVRVHDLRHTFAGRLRALDVTQDDIADLLGHSRGTMTAHYSRVTLEKLISCVDRLTSDDRRADLVLVRKTA